MSWQWFEAIKKHFNSSLAILSDFLWHSSHLQMEKKDIFFSSDWFGEFFPP